MSTIKKKDYPEVFIENEEMEQEDIQLFDKMLSSDLSVKEREFFEKMKAKEEGECAPSADLIMNEKENDYNIYVVRYFFDEYKIGRMELGREYIYALSLNEAINADMFPLLDEHITFLDWLRRIGFKGVNYNGNSILRR